MEIIFDLAKQKPWLREECGFVLCNAIHASKNHERKYAQLIIDKLHEHKLSETPEGIAIWLSAKSNVPNLDFPKTVWRHENPLYKKEKSSLAAVLKDSALVSASNDAKRSKVSQKGAWNTKIHFVWDVVIAKLLEVDSAKKKPKGNKNISFKDFWEECVDSESCAKYCIEADIS